MTGASTFNVLGGAGADTLTVNATLTGSFNGQTGSDTVQGTLIDNVLLTFADANGFDATEANVTGGINDVGQLTRQPNWNFLSLRRVLQVHAACRRDSSSANDQGLAIGQHTAVLQAFVAGVPQPLSLPIEFALQCSMHSSPDGGQLSEPDSGTTSGREADAGVSPPRAPAGCTSASGGWSSVLLALALFRRRRGVPTGVAPRA